MIKHYDFGMITIIVLGQRHHQCFQPQKQWKLCEQQHCSSACKGCIIIIAILGIIIIITIMSTYDHQYDKADNRRTVSGCSWFEETWLRPKMLELATLPSPDIGQFYSIHFVIESFNGGFY